MQKAQATLRSIDNYRIHWLRLYTASLPLSKNAGQKKEPPSGEFAFECFIQLSQSKADVLCMHNYSINQPEGQELWAFSMLIGLEYPVIVTSENKCVFFDTGTSVQILDKAT